MAVRSRVSGSNVIISVNGCFDVSCYDAFNQSYQAYLALEDTVFVIDMRHTTYLDSSALGMLLLLRERVGGDRNRIRFTHVGSTVMETLRIAHFDQLFVIES